MSAATESIANAIDTMRDAIRQADQEGWEYDPSEVADQQRELAKLQQRLADEQAKENQA